MNAASVATTVCSDELAVRGVVMDLIRGAGHDGTRVSFGTNAEVRFVGPESAEVSSWELCFRQAGDEVVIDTILRRTDHLTRVAGRWRAASVQREPFLTPHATGDAAQVVASSADAAPDAPSRCQDHRAIEELNLAYARRIDDGDFTGFADLFANAEWNGMRGADAVRRWLETNIPLRQNGRPGTLHAIGNLSIDIDGDTAVGRSTLVIYRAGSARIDPYIINDYHDRYARDRDGWHFVERAIVRRMRAV